MVISQCLSGDMPNKKPQEPRLLTCPIHTQYGPALGTLWLGPGAGVEGGLAGHLLTVTLLPERCLHPCSEPAAGRSLAGTGVKGGLLRRCTVNPLAASLMLNSIKAA